jgi:hypothetical protein
MSVSGALPGFEKLGAGIQVTRVRIRIKITCIKNKRGIKVNVDIFMTTLKNTKKVD